MTLRSRLEEVETLSHFTTKHLDLVVDLATQRTLAAGEELSSSGDELSHLFLILQGKVAIRRAVPGGWIAFWHLEGGELLGVTSFLTGRSYVDSALAETKLEVVVWQRQALLAAMEEDEEFERDLRWAFWRSTTRDLALANERLAGFFEEEGEAAGRPRLAVSEGGTLDLDETAKKELFREQMLSDDEVDQLAAVTRERRFSPGHVIFAEGDEGNEMYVVHEGEVVISKYIPGAGDEALAFLSRGDYFGEMALLGGEKRSADARARSDGAVVLAIPGDEVERLVEGRGATSIKLIAMLSDAAGHRLGAMLRKITGWHSLAGGDTF